MLVLQDVGIHAMQDTLASSNKARRMMSHWDTITTGLNSIKFNLHIAEERMENANRVASAAHTSYYRPWKFTLSSQYLFPSLPTDNALEIPYHSWIWMRSDNRPNKIVSILNVGDPVA